MHIEVRLGASDKITYTDTALLDGSAQHIVERSRLTNELRRLVV